MTMSKKNKVVKTSSKRYAWVMGLVVLLLVIVMVIRNLKLSSSVDGAVEHVVNQNSGDHEVKKSSNKKTAEQILKARRAEIRKVHPRREGTSPVFAMVEAVLGDEKISDQQAAAQFRDIAQRSDVTETERLEALNHGLILNFQTFEGFAHDPSLPAALAQKYFEELANQSPSETFQINGYLDLLAHSDPDIRKQAADQLAMMIENDSLASDPAALRREVAHYLESLKTQSQEP